MDHSFSQYFERCDVAGRFVAITRDLGVLPDTEVVSELQGETIGEAVVNKVCLLDHDV